ncbi:MAG: DNA primase [Verrucomicrobiaceae bacterium]|nr:MAG: DNA primase [Verrucomicrobiaceae bacterium]
MFKTIDRGALAPNGTGCELAPTPLTLDILKVGAGSPDYQAMSFDPLSKIRRLVADVEVADLLELAKIYFSRSILDSEKQRRKQSQNELIVLVVLHFTEWLDGLGLGARILQGNPHLYGGSHWNPVTDSELEVLLGEFALRLGCDPVAFGIFSTREKMVKQFHSVHGGEAVIQETGVTRVNFQNGTLQITDKCEEMWDFASSDMLTYQLPFDYNEAATCPKFDRYLLRVLPDQSSRLILAEFLGWIFLRELKLEKILVLLGDGHNGKSVFFDIVNALLGEQNISNYGLSSLSKMENRCALGSTLLNFGSEISERCDADLLKKMAAGEPIEARRLYSDPYIMRTYARLAFNANLLPRDTEHTTGFFRRFLIIPFNETITESEKDPELAKKIINTELSGVFNWVMEGLRRLRAQRKFSSCEAADRALATYKEDSDSTAGFLVDGGWLSSSERIGKGELYLRYQHYCRDSGHVALNKLNFSKRLINTHHISESKSGSMRFWNLKRSEESEIDLT